MFYGFVITEAGNNLLAKMVAGDKLTITKVVMDKVSLYPERIYR